MERILFGEEVVPKYHTPIPITKMNNREVNMNLGFLSFLKLLNPKLCNLPIVFHTLILTLSIFYLVLVLC